MPWHGNVEWNESFTFGSEAGGGGALPLGAMLELSVFDRDPAVFDRDGAPQHIASDEIASHQKGKYTPT